MAVQGDRIPWVDADEAHRQVMHRVGSLPRPGAGRNFRDLALLATVTTAGPLAAFGLGVGSAPAVTAALAAIAAGAVGLTLQIARREHGLAKPRGSRSGSRWMSVGFRMIPARHAGLVRSRTAVTASRRTSR